MGRTARVSAICEVRVADDVQEVECACSLPEPRPFVECLPTAEGVAAIRSTSPGQASLTHGELREFIETDGQLRSRGIGPTDVVAVVMPNGPELAVALLTCMSQCIAAPLEPSMSKAEFEAAFEQLGVSHVIALREHKIYDTNLTEACASLRCSLHYAVRLGTKAGAFVWAEASASGAVVAPAGEADACSTWTQAHDTVLLLRTSGTTSKPKVVPLTAHGLYTGAMSIGRGLELTPEDVSLNVMPLTHIGGISCSLLASIFTGGSVICGPMFDPASFVEWLDTLGPTWYYAAPTIHKAVAIYAKAQPESPRHRLRFIRSGAANLADTDARDLQQLFGCTVLPTYSMTECMPVAQPLWDYDLSKPGTVGVPIASSLRVADEKGMPLRRGLEGEVCIKGPVVTPGYLDNEEANASCFFGEPDSAGCRWFRTGDVGHIDVDGYLFLTGRNKELIKRGGEQVSPYEVEEALLQHPSVEIAVVFGVPNDFWGEEVAAAVVLKPGFHAQAEGSTVALVPREDDRRSLSFHADAPAGLGRGFGDEGPVTAGRLRDFLKPLLADSKLPQQVRFIDSAESLPKTRTGKYLRVGLAEHLGLSAVDVAAAQGLQRAALGPPAVAPPVKPDKSIYGVRYFVACWVIFIHIGKMPPAMQVWRGFSPSMPAFFTLAGFLLCSSTTRPITKFSDLCNFYKNRIVAAHPLYLVAVLFALPLTFLICTPNPDTSPDAMTYTWFDVNGQRMVVPYQKGALLGPVGTFSCAADMHRGEAGLYAGWVAKLLVNLFFAQQAFWPWGLGYLINGGFFNAVLWFSSVYYVCLLLFPFLHLLSRRLHCGFLCSPQSYLVRPLLIRYVVVLVAWWGLWTLVTREFFQLYPDFVAKHSDKSAAMTAFFAAYAFPLAWVGEFFMGMLLFNAFELNRRGSNVYLWPYWGVLTDCLTVLLLSVLPAVSILQVVSTLEHVSPETRQACAGFLSHFSDVYNGEATTRLCTLLLCPWIYGLATGQGGTARLLGSPILVKYCGPASYSMYLFHYPVAYYWILLFHPVYNWTPQQFHDVGTDLFDPVQGFLRWDDYLGVVAATTLIALFCTHVLNTRLTAGFLRLVDFLCFPCCRRRTSQEMSTLLVIARAIQGLTGAEVDASTPLVECGLDSFGTGALVGILRPSFPNMRLTAIEVYNLGTVGALAAAIDEDMVCARRSQAGDECGNPAQQPLV